MDKGALFLGTLHMEEMGNLRIAGLGCLWAEGLDVWDRRKMLASWLPPTRDSGEGRLMKVYPRVEEPMK